MTVPILYQDKYLCVCCKPVGVLSEPEPGRRQDMPTLLKRQTRAYRVDVIHRLDQPVGGVMVYSKSAKVTPGLYAQIAGHTVVKEYLAVAAGAPAESEGEMHDWLLKDKVHCKSRVVPAGTRDAKEASLSYQLLETKTVAGQTVSLLRVRLHTGRTHQIRLQCASRGMPLLGDEKYGGPAADGIALWSFHLAFRHPVTGETVDVTCPPAGGIWSRFAFVKTLTKQEKDPSRWAPSHRDKAGFERL